MTRGPGSTGARRARRVVVGVHGTPNSLEALRAAVTEARARSAELWSVLVWTPPDLEGPHRGAPPPALVRVLQQEHLRDLGRAWADALSAIPDDLDVHLAAVGGRPGPVLTRLADHRDDLLVLGSPRRDVVRSVVGSSVLRQCLRRATCTVSIVPPPPLAGVLGRRPWSTRRAVASLVTDARR